MSYDGGVRRRLLVLVLLLVGGAIVNVAVAWGCCVFAYRDDSNVRSRRPNNAEEFERWQSVAALTAEPTEFTRVSTRSSFGYTDKKHSGADVWVTQTVLYARDGTWCEAGFPLRTLRGEWFKYHTRTWREETRGAWNVSSASSQSVLPDRLKYLPLRPIWHGFAINTLFYAALLWVLCGGPWSLRRRLRIKRGLCPKCAYDLRKRPRDSSVCPECGAAAPLLKAA